MSQADNTMLEACIRKHMPDCANDSLCFKRIATGKFNTSYFVSCGKQNWVLRIAPPPQTEFLFYEKDMMLQEPAIHKLLLEKTSIPVAHIIACDTARDIIDSNYLIMERLTGNPVSDSHATDMHAVLFQTGQYLSELHSCTAEKFGYLGEHAPMQPQSTWAEAFTIMWHKIIDDIVRVGHYNAGEEKALKNLVSKHRYVFEECETSSLLHMDIWAQNILVDSGSNVTGIVDWDRALWGDVEIEFAVLDYCGISEPPFWDGYGKRRPQSIEARLRNIFYLLYEIQKYIVIRQGRQGNRASAHAYKDQALQIINRTLA